MNHDHESLGGPNQLDIPYVIHQDDAKALISSITIHEYFNERQMLYDDLEVIPTPGHTLARRCFYGITVSIVIYLLATSYVLKVTHGVLLY